MSYGYSRVEIDADGKEHYYRDGHEFKRMTTPGAMYLWTGASCRPTV